MKRPRVLLTSGRMPKGLGVARALAEKGCWVAVADPLADHLCRSSRRIDADFRVRAPNTDPDGYLEDLLAIVVEEDIELVIPVSEEAVHVAGLAGFLPEPCRLVCATRDRLLGLHDKLAFAQSACAHGLAAPESARADSPEASRLRAAGPTVLKKRYSSAGVAVRFLEAGAPPPGDITPEDWLIQGKVTGGELSSCSLFHEGRPLGSAVYRGTVLDGTVAVAFERVAQAPAILDWIARFGAATGISGFISFDFIMGADGQPMAVECNPRMNSGVHFFDDDALAAALLDPDAVAGIPFKPRTRFQQFFPCLTATYASLFRPRRFGENFRNMLTSRDVLWDPKDPMPLIMMTWTSRTILWRAIREGISLGEAATRDIGWFGQPRARS